jgi:hypothetical protein
MVHGESEHIFGMNGLAFGFLLIIGGFLVYWGSAAVKKDRWASTAIKPRKAA